MPDNVIDIGFKIDRSELKALANDLQTLKTQADALPESFDDVKTSASNMLSYFNDETSGDNSALFSQLPQQMSQTFQALFDSTRANMESLNSMMNSKDMSSDMTTALRQSLGFQNANIRTLMSSARQIGEVYNGIADNVKDSFGSALGDMIRDASRLLRATPAMIHGGTSTQGDFGYVKQLQQNVPFAKGAAAMAKAYGLSDDQMRTLLSGVVQHAVPYYQRADYWRQAESGSNRQLKYGFNADERITDFRKRLPARYHDLPKDPKQITVDERDLLKGQLTSKEYNLVKMVAAQNPSFEQALIATGHATRGRIVEEIDGEQIPKKAGVLHMPSRPISRQAYAEALGYMYSKMLLPALEGAPAYLSDLSSSDAHTQMTQAAKSSRVPHEVYQAAQKLDSINISPVFRNWEQPASYAVDKDASIAISTDAPPIRPDRFQIFSLTRSDFSKGVKLDKSAGYVPVNAKDDRRQHPSINKVYERSLYTDMLGLYGNNTYGNRSKTEAGMPKMLLIDTHDEILATDENGRLIFEDGQAKGNTKALEEIRDQIFKPNRELSYVYNGQEHKYRYAARQYGDTDRTDNFYVPTNIKGSNIFMAREDAWAEMAKRSLEKYGVNIYDNFVDQNMLYETEQPIGKGVEARNRLLTPSVPFSEVGGRMPDKNKVAFVAMESFAGLDGAMLFMPGYVPGGDATIRAPGIKGMGQSVDYKKIIRDLYGEDTVEFKVPFIDAPKEIQERFKANGLSGFSQEEIDQYFIDIMKYDALVTDSVVKSDFQIKHRLNAAGSDVPLLASERNRERQDLFYSVLDDVGGMRVVKTAKDFWTDKQVALSGQMSQNLELTPEDIRENNRLWNEHIDALLYNPVKTIEMLFADPDDPLSQRVRANPALLQSDPEAISRIRDALQSAQMSRAQNEQYARNNAAMGVALPNPAEWIMAAGRRNGLTISNEEQANDLTLHSNDVADEIAVPQWKQTTAVGGGRYPNNQLETFNLINSSAYSKAMQQYGLNPYAVYMNAKTIAKMGGGDFDGDTVQLVRNKLQEYVQQTIKQRREMLPTTQDPDAMREALKSAAIKFDEPRMSNEGDLTNNQLRGALAILKMSSASTTSDSLSQGDWHSKSWVDTIGKSAFALKAIYDIDSTFAKTGIFAEWDKTAKDARKLMGKPFSHIYKNLAGAIENNDFSLLGDLSQVNFPSIYSGLTVGNLSAMQATPLSDAMVESLIHNQDALQGISNMLGSNNPALVARGQYLQFNNQLMSKLLTGRASAVSNQDMDTLQSLWNTWYKAAIPDRDTLSDSDSDSEELREQKYALRKQQARLKFAKQFGVTEDRILNKDGYAGAGFYQDVRYTDDHSVFEVAANAEQDRLRAQAALMVGHNPQIVSATQAAGISQIAGQGIAKANDLKYSFTMLSQLNGDRGDMKEWYEKYILGNWPKEGKNQFEKDVGDAAHKSLEAYAKQRIANDAFNADRFVDESGDEKSFEDVFYDTLKGSPSFRDKEFDINKLTESERNRVKSAAMFARRLNTQFADREFIASEQEVQLPLGYQRHTSGVGLQDKPLNTIGKIDILTRMKNPDGTNNPNNPVIETDLKAHAEKDAFPQLLFYTSGLEKKPGIQETVGYLDESIQKEGHLTSHSMPYNAANANKVLDTAMAKVDAVFQLATLTGLPNSHIPMDAMSTQFADFMPGNTAAAYRAMRDAAFDIPHKGSAADSHEDARTSQEAYLSPEALAQIAASRKLIDSNTGRGIARAMSVEQEIYEFANEMTELAGKFSGKIKRTETGARNPWETYRYLFSEGGIDKRIQLMGEKGASEDDKKRMEIFKADAEAKYAEALRKSAVKDLSDFNENVISDMSSSKADRGIVNYIKQQDELEDAFARAAQAKKVFEEEMEAKQKAGKQLTEDEQKALEEAKIEYRYAKLNKQMQADTIKSRALDSANLSLFEFEAAASGRQLSAQQLAKKDAFQMRQRLESQIGNVDVQLQKGLITDEQADTLYKRIRSTNVDKFEHTRLEHYQAEDARRAAASNKRVENLLTQGRRLNRNIWGRHNNGLLSRSIREWESGQDQYNNTIASLENEIAHEKQTMKEASPDSESYKKASENLDKLKDQLESTQAKSEAFKGAMGAVSTVLGNLGDAIGRVASQFGRQMFHNAMQEAKRFVQEFDASMTEIQMITGKTDPEMSQLGSDLIQTAIDMKVGVSDVTNAAADLYRQGLEDEDVEVRMEDVQKFAKVAKIKSSEASKIITTALSNDLVESSGEAMDALVALGDSAATTASEIAKGMQKSAASAKQAGVSYEQLVTMLTIITSKTQLGGNQAGTALQTLMYRLYRVSEGDDFYDENGNRIAANQASKALSQLGVSIYDDNGNARGAFDIMVDVAKNWDSADSISQEMVLNALGAGRQRSNIATLIQGLAEDEGALMDKYMSLASGSEGITDEKYLSYLNSLQASLDAVKSSFDQLIASFAVSDTASSVLNFIAEFIQGLAAAEEASGALTTGIKMIAAALLGLAAASAVIKVINGGIAAVADMAVGIGALVALGGLWGVSSQGNNVKRTTSPSASNIGATMKERTNEYDDYREVISDSEKLNEKFRSGKITDLEIDKLQSNLNTQTSKFGLASVDLSNVATNAESVAQTLAQANRLQQAEFANQLKGNVAQAKTAVAEEAIASIRSANQFNQLFATAMGGTLSENLLENGELNYDNRDRKDEQTPESIKAIKGYGDLSEPEQELSNAFNMTYYDETGFNWGKANSIDIQNYYKSRMLDEMLSDYVSTGAKSSDKIITAAGLEHYSYERLHQLLTSFSYKDLMETDGEWWAGELHAGDKGVNAEKVFKEKQAQAVAALWQYWDNAYSLGELKFEDLSKKTIDGILTNHVRPVVASMVNSEQLDYVMSQLIYNVYKGLNLNTANGEIVASRINNELETLRDMLLSEGEYAGTGKTIESDYLDKSHKPKWNIYNKDGQIVRENVSEIDLDTFKAQQLQVKQAASVSTESVDMSDWKEKNPKYKWDEDQKNWNIWQYEDSNGNVHLGTYADMQSLQSSDLESKKAARNDRIDVAKTKVNNVKTVQGYYKQIANKRDAISRFQKDAQNVDSYAELRELALGLPEEYHSAVAKQIKESEPAGTPSASNQEQLAFQYASSQFTVDKLREMEKAGQKIDKYVSKDYWGLGKINGFADDISYLDFIKQFDPEAYEKIQKLDEKRIHPAQWVQDQYPLLPAEYKPVQFDFLEEEVERLNDLYAGNIPGASTAFYDANNELKSAQDEVIAVNDIVMQPIAYNSEEEWQAGYDTEYNNQITAIKKANFDALDENFWNTDETGSGFYFSEITQSKQSSPKPVDHLSEALSAGLAAKQTDDVILKNQIDDFARYLAINKVFDDESVDMEKQTDLLTSSHYGDLKTVMTSGIGLAEIIDGVFKKDDKGEYIIQNGKRVLVDDDAWLQTSGRNFYKTLMGASGSYSDVTSASRLIRSQIVKNIKESYDAGYSLGDNEISILSSLYGDSLVAKYQNAALNLWDTTHNANQLNDDGTFKVDEDGGYSNQSASIQAWINEQNEKKERNAIRKNVAGGTYSGGVEQWMTEPLEDVKELTWSEYKKAALKRNAEIRGSANIFTEEEEAFMKILDQNALYGINRLTSQQSLQGAENILGYISRGEYSNYLSNDATMVDTYLSQFSNFGTYASMAHILEDAKVSDGADGFYTMNDILSLEEGSTGYEAVAEAFDKAGISMEEAQKTAEDFNNEISEAKKVYGDFTKEVMSNSKAWKGNKREISNAFKELNSSLAKIGNNQYYRTQFKNGARDKETLEAIGAMIGISGLDEKYVKEHSEYIESLLEAAYESDLEAANVLADSIDEIINLQDFSVDQSNISVDASGNLNMSGVMSALAADQSEYAQNVYSMIQAFAAIGGSVQLVREGSGENMVFKTVVSLGEGAKPRGGGGGGGGKKSATEKLIEEQEHEVKLREHKIKKKQNE